MPPSPCAALIDCAHIRIIRSGFCWRGWCRHVCFFHDSTCVSALPYCFSVSQFELTRCSLSRIPLFQVLVSTLSTIRSIRHMLTQLVASLDSQCMKLKIWYWQMCVSVARMSRIIYVCLLITCILGLHMIRHILTCCSALSLHGLVLVYCNRMMCEDLSLILIAITERLLR